MYLSLASLCVLLVPTAPSSPETHFVQVAPVERTEEKCVRSPKQTRAVVLIHGLKPVLFSKAAVLHADFRAWQEPGSSLVKKLAEEADVYSFAYGQNVAADEVVEVPQLCESVQRLQKLGYTDIVLLGFSAGGLIAREFVEDNPESAVTKVVQVCAPNDGSAWAKVKVLRKMQLDFLGSLTKAYRRKELQDRVDKLIPARVEFVCVVGTEFLHGDGFVSTRSQWSDDLQEQGIPAYTVPASHLHMMNNKKAINVIAEVIHDPQPRWDAKRVAKARKEILGN